MFNKGAYNECCLTCDNWSGPRRYNSSLRLAEAENDHVLGRCACGCMDYQGQKYSGSCCNSTAGHWELWRRMD